MAKRLTETEINDRLTMYEEAAQHLEMSVCDTDGEKEQAKIVAAQIRALAKRLERKFYNLGDHENLGLLKS